MSNANANEDRLKGLSSGNDQPAASGPLPWESKPSTPPPTAYTASQPVEAAAPQSAAPGFTAVTQPASLGTSSAGRAVSLPMAIALGFKNYANFKGRASRSMFWWWVPFYVAALFLAIILDGVLQSQSSDPVPIIFIIAILGLFIPTLSLLVRRLHDTNRSGFWYFISWVPFGGIVLLVFTCEAGTPGPNRFGPDPRQ